MQYSQIREFLRDQRFVEVARAYHNSKYIMESISLVEKPTTVKIIHPAGICLFQVFFSRNINQTSNNKSSYNAPLTRLHKVSKKA